MMDDVSNEQTELTYEAPEVVEVGDFANDTRGYYHALKPEYMSRIAHWTPGS